MFELFKDQIRYFFIKKTPTVIQMESAECGATALGIVLSHYGLWVPLETLRYQCGVSRDGCDAFSVVESAERYGMSVKGYRCGIEDLREVNNPSILYWEHNHFVVLEGIHQNRVYINDPGTGPRSISHEELRKNFSELVLELAPSSTFKKGGEKPSLPKAISSRLARVKGPIQYLLIAQGGLVLLGLAMPIFTRIFIDNVIGQFLLDWQWYILGGMVIAALLASVITRLQAHCLHRLNRRLNVLFSTTFLWHVLRLPMSFFTQRFGGEIINRINLNGKVASLITGQFAMVNIQAIFMLIYLVVMFSYDVLLTLVAIGAGLINLLVLTGVARARRNAYARLQQENAKSIGISIDALQQIETIKASGASGFFFSRIAGYYAKTVNATQAIGKKDAVLSSVSGLVSQLSTAALLGIGCLQVMKGELSIGMLIAFQLLLSAFLSPLLQLMNFANQGETLKIDLQRLDDVFHNSLDPIITRPPQPAEQQVQPTKLPGALKFKEVAFGYTPLDQPFIEGLNLNIEPGKMVALVGPVGCGKSTIARIASNLITPWKGEVRYDGYLADELSRETIAYSVASVDQEIALFSGTIRDNLTLWDDLIPEKFVEEAAKDACIHDEILMRDNGYYALLTEGGGNLSGGQRQRLEIARALVLHPTLLILDEATSSLDAEMEGRIMANIRRRKISCLVIAHRLSTIRHCEEIVVLDRGEVIEKGAHETLASAGGLYQALLQTEWGGNETH